MKAWENSAFGEWLTGLLKLAVPSIGISDPRRFDKDLLERSCYPILVKYAERYAKKYEASFEDAIQDGYVGLRLAAERFDPARNVKFVTYALQYINGYMSREYRSRRNSVPTVSFAAAFDAETGDSEVAHVFVEDSRERVERERREAVQDARERCDALLGRVNPRIRELIQRVHGIGCESESYTGIAKSRGVTRQRIHEQYKAAMQSLHIRFANGGDR